MLPILVWVGLLLAGAGSAHGAGHVGGTHAAAASALGTELPVGPMLAASLLDLTLAAALAVLLRRGRTEARGTEPGVWPYLAGVVGGAGVIFALTSAALGGTAVGQSAMHAMGH
jgi:drug/metabolite transporter (DMT)-like permease